VAITDQDDSVATNANINMLGCRTGAIEDGAIADQNVEILGGFLSNQGH
jgi:hypothetical protein